MSASTTVLYLPFYPAANQVLLGSIVSANPTATAVAISCSPDTNTNACLWPDTTFTITTSSRETSSPQNWDVISSKPATDQEDNLIQPADTLHTTLRCNIRSQSTIGTCTSVYEAYITGKKSTFTETETWTNPIVTLTTRPITITAGLDKLSSASASTTPAPAPSSVRPLSASGTTSTSPNPATAAAKLQTNDPSATASASTSKSALTLPSGASGNKAAASASATALSAVASPSSTSGAATSGSRPVRLLAVLCAGMLVAALCG